MYETYSLLSWKNKTGENNSSSHLNHAPFPVSREEWDIKIFITIYYPYLYDPEVAFGVYCLF